MLPKPGRLLLFVASIQHCGRAPSRLFWGQRFTLAIKFVAAPRTATGRDHQPQPALRSGGAGAVTMVDVDEQSQDDDDDDAVLLEENGLDDGGENPLDALE